MVQGLAFLSKKSWHVNNLSNQKRVWEEEQKQAAEASKTKELARQIQQEREQEELDRIAGKKTTTDRGIDWMYQGGTQGELAKQDAEKRAEEYLLGKEYVGEGAVQGDFDAGNTNEGINSVIASSAVASLPHEQYDSKPASVDITTGSSSAAFVAAPSVHDRNEMFHLRNEDPMWAVSQKLREKEKKRDNTKELYERVVGLKTNTNQNDNDDLDRGRDQERSRKERKRHKKQSKKHKKSLKRRHGEDDCSDSEDDHDHHRRLHQRKHRTRSHSSDSDHDYDHRYHSRRHRRGDDGQHRKYDSHSDDDSFDRRRYHRQHGGHEERRHRYSENVNGDSKLSGRRDDAHLHQKHDRVRDDEYKRESRPEKTEEMERKAGYGLKGVTPSSSSNHVHHNLGPDQELLRKKREDKEQERRRNAELRHSRKRSTVEERKRALQQMQEDALKREERKGEKVSSFRKDDNDGDVVNKSIGIGSASFLNDITKQTHGIAGNESLAARVAQNRHTNQRLHDSFL